MAIHNSSEEIKAGRLQGKVCVITGAAQGIGRAALDAFLREGARIVAIDRQADKLKDLAADPRVTTVAVDVTDAAAVTELAKAHQDASVLLNCAGIVATGTVLDCEPAEFERSFQVNVVAMYNVIRAFLPAMIERRDGSIINMASVVSSVKGAPDRFSYGTSKAAVIGLTKSVARDFIAEGIRCNAISPGTVASPSLDERMSQLGDMETARASFIARQPMGRLGEPEEIAAIALMLASDEARFMTGENIVIDGGMSL